MTARHCLGRDIWEHFLSHILYINQLPRLEPLLHLLQLLIREHTFASAMASSAIIVTVATVLLHSVVVVLESPWFKVFEGRLLADCIKR